MNKQLLAQTAPPPLRGRGTGVRSRAPPVADAARRSTRSGRKNRASEQREDFFGHRKAEGANAAGGYLWSASVRSTDLFFPIIEGKTIFVSSTAKRQRGLSRGNSSPLTRFCLLLAVQKETPAASGANYAFAKGPATPKATTNCPPPQATTGHNKNCPKSTPKRKEGPL